MIPVFERDMGKEEITAVAEAIGSGEITGSLSKAIPPFEEGLRGIAAENMEVQLRVARLHFSSQSRSLISVRASSSKVCLLCLTNFR